MHRYAVRPSVRLDRLPLLLLTTALSLVLVGGGNAATLVPLKEHAVTLAVGMQAPAGMSPRAKLLQQDTATRIARYLVDQYPELRGAVRRAATSAPVLYVHISDAVAQSLAGDPLIESVRVTSESPARTVALLSLDTTSRAPLFSKVANRLPATVRHQVMLELVGPRIDSRLDESEYVKRNDEIARRFVREIRAGLPGSNPVYLGYKQVSVQLNRGEFNLLVDHPLISHFELIEDAPPRLVASTARINADSLWMSGFDASDQLIAVADTGLRQSHAMFRNGKVHRTACFSFAKPGTLSMCDGQDDGTGVEYIIDDPAQAEECTVGSTGQPLFGCGHGTYMMGIAAGRWMSQEGDPVTDPNPNGEFSGVAKGAKLFAIRSVSESSLGAVTPQETRLSILRWLNTNYSAVSSTYKLSAISFSWGSANRYSESDPECKPKDVVTSLRRKGALVVASSGNLESEEVQNDDGIESLACWKNVMAVGATNSDDTAAFFTVAGPGLDVYAPGVGILTSSPGGDTETSTSTGTSPSAPMVAGAAAVLRSRHPQVTTAAIFQALKKTGVPVSHNGVTRNRIDVLAASNRLGPPLNTMSFQADSTYQCQGMADLSWETPAGDVNRVEVQSAANSTFTGDVFSFETVDESVFVNAEMTRWYRMRTCNVTGTCSAYSPAKKVTYVAVCQ